MGSLNQKSALKQTASGGRIIQDKKKNNSRKNCGCLRNSIWVKDLQELTHDFCNKFKRFIEH